MHFFFCSIPLSFQTLLIWWNFEIKSISVFFSFFFINPIVFKLWSRVTEKKKHKIKKPWFKRTWSAIFCSFFLFLFLSNPIEYRDYSSGVSKRLWTRMWGTWLVIEKKIWAFSSFFFFKALQNTSLSAVFSEFAPKIQGPQNFPLCVSEGVCVGSWQFAKFSVGNCEGASQQSWLDGG